MKTPTRLPAPKPETPQTTGGKPHSLTSATLFGARDEVLIAHGPDTYRLRRTRQGKLILTK